MIKLCHLGLLTLWLTFPMSVMAGDKEDLAALLTEFLQGAGKDDAAQHDRFWAPDLVYTSSSGDRFGKAEIMAGFQSNDQSEQEDTAEHEYSAEETNIRVFQEAAVITFKLVGKSTEEGSTATQYYYNTGTFLKRNGQWRAIAWQATKIPAMP